MRWLTRIALLAGLAAVPAVALAATSPQVWVTNCIKAHYKPKQIALSCADSGNNVLTQLKWSSWTGAKATGTGTHEVNSCIPNCASSRSKPYPASVTLSKPKSCKNLSHKVFKQATITYPAKRPPGSKKTVIDTLSCPLR
jgi:hypothetical protein